MFINFESKRFNNWVSAKLIIINQIQKKNIKNVKKKWISKNFLITQWLHNKRIEEERKRM